MQFLPVSVDIAPDVAALEVPFDNDSNLLISYFSINLKSLHNVSEWICSFVHYKYSVDLNDDAW